VKNRSVSAHIIIGGWYRKWGHVDKDTPKKHKKERKTKPSREPQRKKHEKRTLTPTPKRHPMRGLAPPRDTNQKMGAETNKQDKTTIDKGGGDQEWRRGDDAV